MCGIAGIINLDKSPLDGGIIEKMICSERHRGPDDSGLYVNGHVGLGHVRLSIIDLSKDAGQPMHNEDSRLFIVHNGEIYNYLELKDELAGLGHAFRSRSDTEVILHAYEEWGEDCLSRFNGMWAFAILDLNKRVLFCARDRFGVKPFYYHLDKDIFIFASEIKSLLCHPKVRRQPNDSTVFNYLASGYGYMDISDETFFKGIRQLKQAHYATVPLDGGRQFSQKRYWNLAPHKKLRLNNEEEAYENFRDLFEDSIKLRLRSDVPLGVSLSGGLDSSSIACVSARLLKGGAIEAFSSCFDEAEYDEREYIAQVLDKTKAKANFIFTRPENLFDEMEEIMWHQEEPYSTLSIFPQWYVMKLAHQKGVKVLLTGQGGDEVLGGYHKYYFYLLADLVASGKWGAAQNEIRRYRELKGDDALVAGKVFKIMASHIAPQGVKNILKRFNAQGAPAYLDKDFAGHNTNRVFTEKRFGSILNNDLYNALKISPLPSLLHIDDRSSMAHSVESRSPFLDYRLVEYAFSLGPEYKIRDGITKYMLRRSMKGILPEEVRTRTDKMGFATPLEKWFRTDLKTKVYGIINSDSFKKRPYFNQARVQRKLDDFMSGKGGAGESGHFTIWSWVNLELWLRKFIDGR
ncbi:MAG: asparagine synthase (glutamine-hydrolyzing) [Candidatus Omnitrophica bacterium]|nr:asparagine synthase (glutamine-hydrolyzing) [Candidatus Omnitrophota bacterium]